MMTFIRLFLDEFVIVLNVLVLNGLTSYYRYIFLMSESRCLLAYGSSMLVVLDFLVTNRSTIKALSNGVTRICHVKQKAGERCRLHTYLFILLIIIIKQYNKENE